MQQDGPHFQRIASDENSPGLRELSVSLRLRAACGGAAALQETDRRKKSTCAQEDDDSAGLDKAGTVSLSACVCGGVHDPASSALLHSTCRRRDLIHGACTDLRKPSV